MKKITFVQRQDQSSYDPVSTFFNKKKNVSMPKPLNNTSKQSSTITKTTITKPMNQKKQQKNLITQKNKLQPQKIGQKAGSGYIPKKVGTTQQKLSEQTIYNHKDQIKKQANNLKPKQSSSKIIYQQPQQRKNQTKAKQQMKFSQNVKDYVNYFQRQEDYSEQEQKINEIKKSLINKNSNKTQYKQAQNVNNGKKNSLIKQAFSNSKPQQVQQNTNKQQTYKKPSNITNSINNPNNRSNTQKKPPSNNITKAEDKTPKPPIQTKSSNQTVIKNQNQAKTTSTQQWQAYEQQYIRKIQHLQLQIQTLTKTQQKYNKLLKQHKFCTQKNKDINTIKQQLKQAKQSITRFMSEDNITYSKKRQFLLLNQINQLKRYNRDLTLRIKNYKGTDLVEMSMNRNKEEITRQYDIDYQEEYNKLNKKMQSMLSILIHKIYEYLEIKSGKKATKNKQKQQNVFSFEKQQAFLQQINSLAQKMSLTYLQKYEISPLPKCNQDAMNLYAQIQKEKENILKLSKSFVQPISKQQLNFAITQSNLQIINQLGQNEFELKQLEQKIQQTIKSQSKPKQKTNARPSTSHGVNSNNSLKNQLKPTIKKIQFMTQIYKKRSYLSSAFHIQSVCYFTFLKELVDKKMSKLQNQLTNLYGRLKEMKDIFDLGGSTAKQSLYLYLDTNLQNFTLIVPNLQLNIKQIKSFYKQFCKRINSKIKIKNL